MTDKHKAENKTESTKAPEKRDDSTDKPVTKLATTEHPAKLKDAEIKDMTGDDGSDTMENSANADAAEAMKEDRAAAKGKHAPTSYHHSHGGAADL